MLQVKINNNNNNNNHNNNLYYAVVNVYGWYYNLEIYLQLDN